MSCFKKGVLSIAALSVSALAFAGPDLDSRVKELEKDMKQVRTETAAKTYGAYATSSRPEVDGKGFFFSFDVFYWQLEVEGTEFAYTDTNTIKSQLPASGRVEQLGFDKWNWGFKVGAGYNFDHGEWDIYANYTHFTNNSNIVKGGGIRPTIISEPIVGVGNAGYSAATPVIYTTGRSQFKYSFNRIDLELGRDFFVAKYLSMRPHVGLIGAWSEQKQSSRFTGGDINGNTVFVCEKNEVSGIGPRTGLNTKWHLCNNFSLIGNTSAALVYNNYKLKRDQHYSIAPLSNDFYLSDGFHRFSPTAQIQLGFGYDNYTTDCKQHISAFLIWDVQYWWNYHKKITRGGFINSQDVSMQGVTLGLKVDF